MSLLYMKGWGMNTNVNGRGWALVCALVMGASAVVGQATAPSVEGVGAGEEKGRAVVRGAIEHFQNMRSCAVVARWRHEASKQGKGQWEETIYEALIERPGKFALIPRQNPRGLGTVVCDGQTVTASLPGLVAYVQKPVGEGGIGEAVKDEDIELVMGPAGVWMNVLIDPEVGRRRLEEAKRVEWVRSESVEGRECDYVRMELGGEEGAIPGAGALPGVELWIARGDEPVVVRGRWVKREGNYYSEANKTMVADVVTFEQWVVNHPLPSSRFVSEPPQWAQKVESFKERMVRPAAPAGVLVGQEAPTFAAKTLDGKMVDLAALRDKEVVVLDFWATWCPPCEQSLAELAKVAVDYADKPVTVLAVNDGEDEATVRKFLEEKGLKLNVVMDEQGKIVQMYGVSAIPRTVVIGKDGKVVMDSMGYSAASEQEVREAVDKALTPPEGAPEASPGAPAGAGKKQGAPAPRAPR